MKYKRRKIIGILGGLGPESTGFFYLDLIETFVNNYRPKSNEDYPHIIINSIPAPDLINNRNKASDLEFYIDGLRLLESAGVDYIAIACNSAHAYLDLFKKEIKTPIINLPQEVEKYLKLLNKKRVVIFGSKTTIDKKLYEFDSLFNVNLDKKDAN